MLRSCPRCTQVLPASAAFCRRCGAAVDASARPVVGSAPAKARPGISIFNLAMLLVAIAAGAIAFLRVQSTPTAVQSSPAYYNPPAQPVYPQVQITPVYPEVPATPVYRNRDARNEGSYYIRTDGHDRGR